MEAIKLLDLPENIKQVESHLSWMDGYFKQLEDSKGKIYLDRLIGKLVKEVNTLDDWTEISEEYHEQNPKYISFFATMLNHATFAAYLGEAQRCKEYLDKMDNFSEIIKPDFHSRIIIGVKYAAEALNCCVSSFHPTTKDFTEGSSTELETFSDKWENIERDNIALATIQFLKGSLAEYLGVDSEHVLKIFDMTVELDPDYAIWYHYVNRKLRQVNREQRDRSIEKQARKMCELAYEKSDDEKNLLCVIDLAMALKDGLNADDADDWHDVKEADYQKCWALLRDGLEIANVNGLLKWTRKIMLMQAEFLLYTKTNDHSVQVKGKKLLFDCLEQCPDSNVHHKVGRLFQQESALDVTQKWRLRKAQEHFIEALKLDPGNFHCLKDYMKLINHIPDRTYDDYLKTLDILRNGIKLINSDYQTVELYMWQGCFAWIYNPEQNDNSKQMAIESWLHIVKYFPEYLDHLMTGIENPPFKISYNKWQREPAYINLKRVMAELNVLRRESQSTGDYKTINAIDVLYDELKTLVKLWESRKNSANFVYPVAGRVYSETTKVCVRRELDNSSGVGREGQSYEHRIKLKSDKGLADMDSNWRSDGKK